VSGLGAGDEEFYALTLSRMAQADTRYFRGALFLCCAFFWFYTAISLQKSVHGLQRLSSFARNLSASHFPTSGESPRFFQIGKQCY